MPTACHLPCCLKMTATCSHSADIIHKQPYNKGPLPFIVSVHVCLSDWPSLVFIFFFFSFGNISKGTLEPDQLDASTSLSSGLMGCLRQQTDCRIVQLFVHCVFLPIAGKGDKDFIMVAAHWLSIDEEEQCRGIIYVVTVRIDSPDDLSSARERVLFILCAVFVYFTYLFAFSCFCLIQMSICKYTHSHRNTRTHIRRLIPPAARGASWQHPASPCQLVPVSVLHEWRWNESHLIWETHLVPSFLSLSSNHPSGRPGPSMSASRPAPHLAVQRSAPKLQSNPLSCERVKSKQKVKNIHSVCTGVVYSLQSRCILIGRTAGLCLPWQCVRGCSCAHVRRGLYGCVVCVPGGMSWRISTVLQVTAACCQAVCVCVCTRGAETTIGLGGLQQYNHLTQEDTIEDREKNTQSFTHPSNPYFTRQHE